MKTHAGLSGHTEWQVLDAAGRVVNSGEHHNLITDAGLDGFMVNANTTSDLQTRYGAFRSVPSVGTSSTAPSVSKTALGNPVPITYNAYKGDQISTYAIENNYAVGRFTQVRHLNFTNSHNLTEYGLSAANNGPLSITELFRDAQGTPVALTVQPGFVLRLTHTLTVRLPLTPQAVTLDLGSGPQQARAGFLASQAGLDGLFNLFLRSNNRNVHGLKTRGLNSADVGNPMVTSLQQQPYVSGSYRVTDRLTVEPSYGVGQWYGLAITPYGDPASAFRLMFDSYTLQKTDSQRLTLDYTFSWGRA